MKGAGGRKMPACASFISDGIHQRSLQQFIERCGEMRLQAFRQKKSQNPLTSLPYCGIIYSNVI